MYKLPNILSIKYTIYYVYIYYSSVKRHSIHFKRPINGILMGCTKKTLSGLCTKCIHTNFLKGEVNQQILTRLVI